MSPNFNEEPYIRDQVTKTNGRARDLERWRDTTKAKVVGMSLTISLGISR